MSSTDLFNNFSQPTATTIDFDRNDSSETTSTEFGNYQKFRISGTFAVEAYAIKQKLVYGLPVELLDGYFDGNYIVDTTQLPLKDNDCVQLHSWEINLRNSQHQVIKIFASHLPDSQANLENWENYTLCKFSENSSFLQLAFPNNFQGQGKVNVSKDVYGETLSLAVFLHDVWGEGTVNVVSGKSQPFYEIVSLASKAQKKVSSRIKTWLLD